MNRFVAIPWPLAGLVLTLALLGQEVLFRWAGTGITLEASHTWVGLV